MRVVQRRIVCPSRATEVELFLSGDWHVGSHACDRGELARRVSRYGGRNRYWLGMGDYSDLVTWRDKRFDPAGLDRELFQEADCDINRFQDACVRETRRLMESVAGNCLGLLKGNHEDTAKLRFDVNLLERVIAHYQDGAGGKANPWFCDLTCEALIVLQFCRLERGSCRNVTLFVAHGAGAAATIGGRGNKLQGMANIIPDADVYACGHYHEGMAWHVASLRPVLPHGGGDGTTVERRRWFVMVPSFHRTYVTGASTYASKRLYRPSALGDAVIRIRPFACFKHGGEETNTPQIAVDV